MELAALRAGIMALREGARKGGDRKSMHHHDALIRPPTGVEMFGSRRHLNSTSERIF
jgi:hypothetical protein